MCEFMYEIVGSNNDISLIIINRPETLNTINGNTINAFRNLLNEVNRDEHIRCVILTGAGRIFPAVIDNTEEALNDKRSDDSFGHNFAEVLDIIEQFRVPVIAAINGYALGVGLEIALACDIRIASSPASFGLPEIALTSVPNWGTTQRLLRLISPSRAKQMLFTGEKISAEEAYRIGLVDKLTTSGTLMDTALSMAEKIAERDPVVMKYLKVATSNDLSAITDKM